ncbi:MAG: hypothetical protein OMM_08781 [Candidatus Magnetoglobus multicellularis str. Araruama]|uniref:Uncharacterized protein n=1 Tax=Candidatus Magnetoglobus multicellularis str. Araruama TaxID=890399 RepID=A0A1V1P6Q2_9BACT|nr:MAG: hypothetical protein OMM_08781 [Candidatus Magnetoglobus multicellularis str. Araruama]
MVNQNITKQLIQYNKSVFENAYTMITMLQDYATNLSSTLISQIPWFPEDAKKAIQETSDLFKEARSNYKMAVDDGFLKLQDMSFSNFDDMFRNKDN